MTNNQLPPQTQIAHAHLLVSDRDIALQFYAQLIGLKPVQQVGATTFLSPTGKAPYQILLTENRQAEPQNRRAAGLYHVAIRFANRAALATVVKRLLDHNWPFQGASDHGVSEAFYLADPFGNGLELYVDRPRQHWQWDGEQIAMSTGRLDVAELLSTAPQGTIPLGEIDPGTDIGHLHLQASTLDKGEQFYHQLLGLDVMQRNYPGALFLAAGGYHHHLGLNTWQSQHGPATTLDQLGLQSFALTLPDAASWQAACQHLSEDSELIYLDYGYAISAQRPDLDGIPMEIMVNKSELVEDELATIKFVGTY